MVLTAQAFWGNRMATSFPITCPECDKKINVSTEVIGKKIRCKECGHVFLVKQPKNLQEKSKSKDKPADDKAPAKGKSTPAPSMEDDDDDGKTPFKLIIEDEGIARCPNCAKEMESKEAIICLNCGYNTMTRNRAERIAVYEPTGQDRFQWLLPGILCVIGIITLITICIITSINTRSWMEGGWFQNDDDKKWLVKPGCFIFFNVLISIFLCLSMGRFAYRRLVLQNQPPEHAIEKDKEPDAD